MMLCGKVDADGPAIGAIGAERRISHVPCKNGAWVKENNRGGCDMDRFWRLGRDKGWPLRLEYR